MGKSKQRVKNNARPSSSARSAELVGSTGFVGFAAHAELGMVPLVPGFSTLESAGLPEALEANINSEFQLVFRKMSKKDPMTKKKALQEFVDLVTKLSLDENKAVLPVWPKFYQNLATDPEHMVRELAQIALRTLVSKCKRAVAPYIKQLVPQWLISQFDNYAPAASIATLSFRETFAGNVDRTQEVLLHCQAEIIEKAERNLTFHTASTLSSGKGLEPEEAEQKYQRAVVGSLKMLSFLVENTRASSENSEKICSDLKSLIDKQKFWSLAASKTPPIRAACFEFLYQLLQVAHGKLLLTPVKNQVITLSFQNIDHTDASIASFAWGCVLLSQESFDDWHTIINLHGSILPKVYNLLRNEFNRNASIICPNLLPFFSKLSPDIFKENNYFEFCKQFFSELKSFITVQSPYSMTELNAVIRANFECLRYLSQKLNNTKELSSEQESLAFWLVNEIVIPSIFWFLESQCAAVKCYFQETSSLIGFWASHCGQSDDCLLYSKLLEHFLKSIFEKITAAVQNIDVSEKYLEHISILLHDLYTANPNFERQKIKFNDEDDRRDRDHNVQQESITDCNDINKCDQPNKIIEKTLKELVGRFGKLCMQICRDRKSIKYMRHVRQLTNLFGDTEFFENLSTERTITATLDDFKSFFENGHEDDEMYELLVNIIFEILQYLEPNKCFAYIKTKLLKDSRKNVKILVLQRLLSYPFCNEPAVRDIIAEPEISSLVVEIAREAIKDNSTDKLNMLHKCFFQAETGEILINQITVDGILNIFCEALSSDDQKDVIELCGSFLAQTMLVFCSGNNASENVKNKVFLHLFEITMKYLEGNEYISLDTLWEITTCWQDTLSSGDISMNKNLLQACCLITQKYLSAKNLKPTLIDTMADSLSKLILCSTEHIAIKDDRLKEIDDLMSSIFYSKELSTENISDFEDLSHVLEATKYLCSTGCQSLNDNCLMNVNMLPILKGALLNLTTMKKLICEVPPRTEPTEEECSEDYCDINANLLTEWSDLSLAKIMEYFRIAAVGDIIVNNALYPVAQITEEYAFMLSETMKEIISNDSQIILTLTEKLMEKASNDTSFKYSRIIPFLVYSPNYARFEENATIILEEALCNRFVDAGAFGTYVCCLQYMLRSLSPKAITMQNPIMRCEPSDMWIKAAMFRCLVTNNFDNVSINDTNDKSIALAALQFITDVVEKNHNNKDILLYNTTVHEKPFRDVINIVEYINLFGEVIEKFPQQMTLKIWDVLRLGLSSWTLSVSKSLAQFKNPATFIFISRVFGLYEKLKTFIISEKQKSSTTTIMNVIEEWENLFARDVDLVLYKAFFNLCDEYENSIDSGCYSLLMEEIVPAVELIDYSFVYGANKEINNLSTVCNFLLKHLSNRLHSIRTCCAHILHQMTPHFVAEDILNLEKDNESFGGHNQSPRFHFLNHFDDYLTRYTMPICNYLKEFSFKLPEINDFSQIDRNEAMSYFLLWDCIIHACANSPVSLRSIYTSWLHENRHEENFLHFLFRAMPMDILKNHDSKLISSDIFKSLSHSQMKDSNIPIEKFACHMYTEILRKLPALVRKWWNACPSRQKTFVDKLTTNFVSSLICYEELKTIANRREKHENMQVTVHNSTREVLAVYSIDDARMELVITLPHNYPLGAVKVECGKQIGGRSSSRNIGMQLSIFLTHQNGTICDGLTLWKGNLDKKFEGVEECYICYTVIHQDTCQLPKLSCKTCKKKFHSPCLYKWFTTSSKSTCPICRNVF